MPLNTEGKAVAVIGSRTFADKAKLFEVLDKNKAKIKLIVSGGARGADSLAVEWATERGMPYLVFPALWKNPETGEHDRGAGFRRNRYIVQYSDIVMAFWDGKSGGTANSLEIAKQLNKPVRIIPFVETAETETISLSGDGKSKHISLPLTTEP